MSTNKKTKAPVPSKHIVASWVASWHRDYGHQQWLDLNAHIAKYASEWGYNQAMQILSNEHHP
jgi:hypothetical protein